MKNLNLFDSFLNEDENLVNSKMLRHLLWEKGWKQYWDAEDKFRKMLDQYRSVSSLPPGTDEKTLNDLSEKLTILAEEIDKITKSEIE